jgi:hypothetical protein
MYKFVVKFIFFFFSGTILFYYFIFHSMEDQASPLVHTVSHSHAAEMLPGASVFDKSHEYMSSTIVSESGLASKWTS